VRVNIWPSRRRSCARMLWNWEKGISGSSNSPPPYLPRARARVRIAFVARCTVFARSRKSPPKWSNSKDLASIAIPFVLAKYRLGPGQDEKIFDDIYGGGWEEMGTAPPPYSHEAGCLTSNRD
jgi:hypothetical protein